MNLWLEIHNLRSLYGIVSSLILGDWWKDAVYLHDFGVVAAEYITRYPQALSRSDLTSLGQGLFTFGLSTDLIYSDYYLTINLLPQHSIPPGILFLAQIQPSPTTTMK
ncbi:hypothetical protein QAD02_018121 [Eretmocerus hayati]|uniref:Uncharacterized protein n=1 Tax=Eretmocerus hayati TaxID=131215 RepID=A0ACC2PFG7_9HYME|nr:hypothetical protein QAD02_018121 [Eretmocerus hayati]